MGGVILIAVLLSCCQLLEADLLSLAIRSEGYIDPYPEECSIVLQEFAQSSANFTLCSIENARPIRLCEKCVQNYMLFHSKYHELVTKVVNGTSCRSIFISHDRLDVITVHHNNILTIWDNGNCNNCFEWANNFPILSNKTRSFNSMFNETMDCIKTNYEINSTQVCEKCMQLYVTLDDFYKTLSEDSIGVETVCMDIVDSMNATRAIWSKILNCCKLRRTPQSIFLICTGIISFLPLLFYLVVRHCGPIQDLPNVLRQTRFKQTFPRNN